MMHDRARLRWILRLTVTAALILWLFRLVDLSAMWATLRAVRVPLFLAAVAGGFAVQWLTGAQMRLGLAPFGIRISTGRLFRIGLISGFYSLVIPGGMVTGGAVTWLKLTRDSGQGLASAAMVVYLRAMNTALLVFMGTLGAYIDPSGAIPGLRPAFTLLSAFALTGLLGIMIPAVGRCLRRGLVLTGRRFGAGLHRRICLRLVRVFHCVYWIRGTRMALLLTYGLLINLGFLLVWFFFAEAVRAPVAGMVVAWIACVQGILQLVPVTIGGLGVREGSLALLLEPYGMNPAHAIALSMTVFAAMVLGALAGAACEAAEAWTSRRRRTS